jgi:inner membrane protein
MPTVFSHAIAGAALATALRPPGPWRRVVTLAALCAVAPDADVVAIWFGVPWGHVLGHRGITHSLAFAAVLAAVVVWLGFRGPAWRSRRGVLWLALFVATASHGVLDSLTNGGSGIAFLAPFDDTRYFAPWQPIRVSPISLSRFLSERGLRVLRSEMVWVWLPSAILLLGAVLTRGRRARSR